MEFNGGNAPAIGRAIYNEKILPTLGPEHKGKVVVIDVKSGDYEIDRSDLAADLRLRKRRPNALHLGGTGRVSGGASHRGPLLSASLSIAP